MNTHLPDGDQFDIKECWIADDECILVTPKNMGVEWNDENKIFRSSIWRKSDMYPVSLGFKKFVNYGEKPEFEPFDPKTEKWDAVIKKDGSCLIVSVYKKELIIRTRGTTDATNLPNGAEIDLLKEEYPLAFNNCHLNTENITLLFEWTTPSNRIVLQESSTPTLWLIGAVMHDTYEYVSQYDLNQIALELDVERPDWYYGEDFEELQNWLQKQTDIEGVVVYSESGILKKLKTPRYLHLHKVFTGIKSVDNLVDLWIEYGCSHRDNFETLLATTYDWELVTPLKSLIDEMFERWNKIQIILGFLKLMISQNIHLPRKDLAKIILQSSGVWSSIAFEILDGKSHKVEKLFELLDKESVWSQLTT
jgi:hypothetical protein